MPRVVFSSSESPTLESLEAYFKRVVLRFLAHLVQKEAAVSTRFGLQAGEAYADATIDVLSEAFRIKGRHENQIDTSIDDEDNLDRFFEEKEPISSSDVNGRVEIMATKGGELANLLKKCEDKMYPISVELFDLPAA